MSRRAEEQTEMKVTTPRGGRFHVTQREGAYDLTAKQWAYTNHDLAHAPALSGRTLWREAHKDEPPKTSNHNYSTACVEARAEALVDLRAPPEATPHERNKRMENTTFEPVTRDAGQRVATCLTCQAASQAGSQATKDTAPEQAMPSLDDKNAFPSL